MHSMTAGKGRKARKPILDRTLGERNVTEVKPAPGTNSSMRRMGGKMTGSRKTSITIETERVLVVEGSSGCPQAWCEVCGKLVRMVSPEEVASLVSRLQDSHCPLEIGKLHFIGTREGAMLVCVDSLLEQS
jgi:hypothetical protein